jgi:hypothetical protein
MAASAGRDEVWVIGDTRMGVRIVAFVIGNATDAASPLMSPCSG